MAAQNDSVPMRLAERVNVNRQPPASITAPGVWQREFNRIRPAIQIRELERNQPQADTTFPRLAQQAANDAIHIRFQICRFKQTFVGLILRHVVIANLDCEGADAPALIAHRAKKTVRHTQQHRLDIPLVSYISGKSFLFAE